VFRDKHRNHVASTELRLSLTDFVSEAIANSFAAVQNHVLISSATLCEYLAEAEDLQRVDDLDDSLETPLKWVGPPTPSPEELHPSFGDYRKAFTSKTLL
jgi:hypothetical protein